MQVEVIEQDGENEKRDVSLLLWMYGDWSS